MALERGELVGKKRRYNDGVYLRNSTRQYGSPKLCFWVPERRGLQSRALVLSSPTEANAYLAESRSIGEWGGGGSSMYLSQKLGPIRSPQTQNSNLENKKF